MKINPKWTIYLLTVLDLNHWISILTTNSYLLRDCNRGSSEKIFITEPKIVDNDRQFYEIKKNRSFFRLDNLWPSFPSFSGKVKATIVNKLNTQIIRIYSKKSLKIPIIP